MDLITEDLRAINPLPWWWQLCQRQGGAGTSSPELDGIQAVVVDDVVREAGDNDSNYAPASISRDSTITPWETEPRGVGLTLPEIVLFVAVIRISRSSAATTYSPESSCLRCCSSS